MIEVDFMDIVLVCNFWHFEFEKESSRYRSLAEVISQNSKYSLEVITSSFRHQTKKQRNIEQVNKIKTAYKVTLLNEPSYENNISVKRFLSHRAFSKNVLKYLEQRKKPDLIILSVPSLSVGSTVSRFAKRNGIKLIVDIQDLWPEAFRMALNIPIISDMLFLPMKLQANRIYSRADEIMAVSNTYVNRGKQCNSCKGFPLFIGTDSKLVAEALKGKEIEKPENEFWIGYVGALGYSYDITAVIKAISLLQSQGYGNIVFKIMGEGILEDKFKAVADEYNVNCDFTGFLEYGEMMATLKKCDIAVNPIVGNSVASIINKVSDYAMAGVPVVNTQNSEEYKELIEQYKCGINCRDEDTDEIAAAIRKLYDDKALRDEMGTNSLRLGTEKFDRSKTYPEIFEVIERLFECNA